MAKLNSSPLRDFRIKAQDTKKRLGKVFAAFIKLPTGAYFITGGKEPPFLYGNKNFKCVCVGGSSLDINEIEDILREIGSSFGSTFSEDDLHALVVATYASRAMQLGLEDLDSPRGVAAEFMVLDIGEKVLKIRYDGNIETEELDIMEVNFTIIGAYDPVFRRVLLEELKRAPADVTLENTKEKLNQVEEIALSIKRRLKLEHVGLLM